MATQKNPLLNRWGRIHTESLATVERSSLAINHTDCQSLKAKQPLADWRIPIVLLIDLHLQPSKLHAAVTRTRLQFDTVQSPHSSSPAWRIPTAKSTCWRRNRTHPFVWSQIDTATCSHSPFDAATARNRCPVIVWRRRKPSPSATWNCSSQFPQPPQAFNRMSNNFFILGLVYFNYLRIILMKYVINILLLWYYMFPFPFKLKDSFIFRFLNRFFSTEFTFILIKFTCTKFPVIY